MPNERLCDPESRRLKAEKILAVLEQQPFKLPDAVCVDIGCAFGLITRHLAEHTRLMIGVERDFTALSEASSPLVPHLLFIQADAQTIPLTSASVDIAICAQVYEHVADDTQLFSEIHRILKPGGICFFSGPNRLFPYEYHWRLPFVHWLPVQIAQKIANRLARQPAESICLRTQSSLRQALNGFDIKDYTLDMLTHPARYHLESERHMKPWIQRLPASLLKRLVFLAPNFNWLLVKRLVRELP